MTMQVPDAGVMLYKGLLLPYFYNVFVRQNANHTHKGQYLRSMVPLHKALSMLECCFRLLLNAEIDAMTFFCVRL